MALALLLAGCASQERSTKPQPAAVHSFTNLYSLPGKAIITTHSPNERFVYVAGEVKLPGRIAWTSGLTLASAVNLAGGFTDFASRSHVTLRRANGTNAQFSVLHLVTGSTNNPTLLSGDLVQVPARHLVWQWP